MLFKILLYQQNEKFISIINCINGFLKASVNDLISLKRTRLNEKDNNPSKGFGCTIEWNTVLRPIKNPPTVKWQMCKGEPIIGVMIPISCNFHFSSVPLL